MYKCNCGREFKIKHHYDMHKPHCKGPRYCQNPECNKLLVHYQKKFCSATCSAKMTTKGRKHTVETKKKISLSCGGKGKLLIKKPCLNCGILTNNPKYCSIKCSQESRRSNEYHKLPLKIKKEILWKEQGEKCNRCNFNLHTIENGPYEIHHKDGNRKNKSRENEELLCCNCHSMTKNYRFKGRKHSLKSKQKISIGMKNVYKPPSPSGLGHGISNPEC